MKACEDASASYDNIYLDLGEKESRRPGE